MLRASDLNIFMSNIEQIKQLREETGISIGECKKALETAAGDLGKAKEVLKQWGKDLASKKSERSTGQGMVDSYIHCTGKVGVLLELRCETDFVANSDDFKNLSHELCLQVAAAGTDETPLLAQPWIKDPSKCVKDLIDEVIAKVGENITIKQVARFSLND